MTDGSAPSSLLKVHGSSRLAFGATTAALVTLASGGTAILVAQATDNPASPTSLPAGALPPDRASDPGGLVVDHAAGASPSAAPAVAEEPSERALREALAQRTPPGRRTLTAPLVPLATPSPVTPPAAPPPKPVVVPDGPVTDGTGVTPPAVVREPTTVSGEDDKSPQRGRGLALGRGHVGHPATPAKAGSSSRHDSGAGAPGKHARTASHGKGKHAR